MLFTPRRSAWRLLCQLGKSSPSCLFWFRGPGTWVPAAAARPGGHADQPPAGVQGQPRSPSSPSSRRLLRHSLSVSRPVGSRRSLHPSPYRFVLGFPGCMETRQLGPMWNTRAESDPDLTRWQMSSGRGPCGQMCLLPPKTRLLCNSKAQNGGPKPGPTWPFGPWTQNQSGICIPKEEESK